MGKIRLDQLVTERGLVRSREEAKRRILAGHVRVDGVVVPKPGTPISEEATVELVGGDAPYVSRGGLKLERALDRFDVDVRDSVALDAGASTGGFTDCLLQRGARLVYALDVGYGQLAWKLRTDRRVRVVERTNVRYVTPDMFDPPTEIVTADLAFIGLVLVLPVFAELLPTGGDAILLVKPQFEAGREHVEKGGVVRDPEVHENVLRRVAVRGADVGLAPLAVTYSPIRGPAGNIEFFIHLRKGARPKRTLEEAIAATVEEAHLVLSTPGTNDEKET